VGHEKERAQRCRARCDRYATPAVSTPGTEKGINIVDGDIRDRRFGRRDVPQESFDLPTSVRTVRGDNPRSSLKWAIKSSIWSEWIFSLPAGDTANNSRKRSQSVAT
jgi:hypothetical protein